jgi:hypothetical protein
VAQAISSQQVNLTWTDNSGNETGFAIYRRSDGGDWVPIAVIGPNITQFVDNGVRPSITYTYRVQAINDLGTSGWSNEASVIPLGSQPANLLVNGSFEEPHGDRFSVSGGVPGWQILKGSIDILTASYWQPAPDGGSQSIDLLGSPGVGTIQQSFPAVPGQDYLFSGYVSHNPSVTYGRANVLVNGALLAQLSHQIPNSSTNMQWQPFAYRFRATTPTTTLTLSDVTGINDSQGTVLDGLSVTVAGNEPPPVTPTAPAAPTNLAAKAVSPTEIDLTWTDNSNNEVQFILYRKSGTSDFVRIGQVASGVTSYSDRGLSPGTSYTYLVRAWNPAGASTRSNEASATTPSPGGPVPLTPPNTPTDLRAPAISDTKVELDWSDRSDNENGFVIYRKSGNSDFTKVAVVGANVTSYLDQGLTPGTTFTYVVRAWNAAGASHASNPVTVTTRLTL